MSGLWDFLKRHRGKIVAGAVIAGGAFVVQQTLQNSRQLVSTGWHHVQEFDRTQLQARRHYIYDTQHRTCDASILDLLPGLAKRIALHFNVETLIDELKSNKELSKEQRIIQWQDIKVKSIARMVAVAYAFSLITVTLKCQISILAAQLCSSLTEKEEDRWLYVAVTVPNAVSLTPAATVGQSAEEPWSEKQSFYKWNQYLPDNLRFDTSLFNFNASPKRTVDPTTQQIFIKCCQFFVTTGLDDLMKSIETVCKTQLDELELKTPVDGERLKEILLNLKRRIDLVDCRHFSYLVVPKFANKNGFAVPDIGQLDALLTRLVEMLESTKCKVVTSSLVDFFIDAVVHFVNQHSNNEELPMARVLPLVTDSFHTLSRSGFDSPIQNILCSTELHQLSMHVFSLPPVEF